jgi:hypothetical protein
LEDLPLELYSLSVLKEKDENGEYIYDLGEPIAVEFTACRETMNDKDWLGIYKCNSNPKPNLTSVESQNRWIPVSGDTFKYDICREGLLFHRKSNKKEYFGETHIEIIKSNTPGFRIVKGRLFFQKHLLPWKEGNYEIRYHHDEKYGVCARTQPLQIKMKLPIPFIRLRNSNFAGIQVKDFENNLRIYIKRCLDLDESIPFDEFKGMLEFIQAPPLMYKSTNPTKVVSSKRYRLQVCERMVYCILKMFNVELLPESIEGLYNFNVLCERVT